MRRLFALWVVLAIVAPSAAETLWYRLELGGVPAGWRRVDEQTVDGQRIWTSIEFLRINRGGQVVEIEAQTTWIDTPSGVPIELRMRQQMGDQPVESVWRFKGDTIEMETTQGGRVHTSTIPAPTTPWLTPLAARSLLQLRGDAGADVIEFNLILPDLSTTPLQQRLERLGTGTVHWQGRDLPVTKWKTTTSGLPFTGEVQYSSDWRQLAGAMNLPFGTLSDTIAGPEAQLLEGETPELFTSLFVEPTTPLKGAHQLQRLVLRLRAKDGRDIELESAGAQSIAGSGPGRITVVVEPGAPLPVYGDEVQNKTFLEASSLIDSADPHVVALVHKAVPQRDANWLRRAEAMRDFVRRWIRTKGLATAFASASETAVNREGDCSEHGVLLAAMLRADGIPSRVATGLVWIDWANAFGWHMWTQALIDGHWVDLDATLDQTYSAGHVLVSTSALTDGNGQGQLVGLLGLLGNIDIDVVEARP